MLLILLIIVTSLQPIFAAQETHISVYSNADKYVFSQDGDYMIYEHHQKPCFNISLWGKDSDGDKELCGWCWLNIYLYKINDTGSCEKLIWTDKQKTGFTGGPVETEEICLSPGNYRLLITFNGESYWYKEDLNPCRRTVDLCIK